MMRKKIKKILHQIIIIQKHVIAKTMKKYSKASLNKATKIKKKN